MCLQPIMVIKAICAPGLLARKQRTADADWSLLCCPPFSFTSVINTWAKPTQMKPKKASLPLRKNFCLGHVLHTLHNHTWQGNVEVSGKSGVSSLFALTRLWPQELGRSNYEPLFLFLAGMLTKDESFWTFGEQRQHFHHLFVVDAAKVIRCLSFNTGTEKPKQVITFLHGRSDQRYKEKTCHQWANIIPRAVLFSVTFRLYLLYLK